MNIALWIVQGILAIMYGMAGFAKLTTPADELIKMGMSFVDLFGSGMTHFIGISEVLGAVGLILPAALRIKPILTPIAASGIALIMLLATAYHFYAGEPPITIVLFALAAFVAWGRFKKAPITSK